MPRKPEGILQSACIEYLKSKRIYHVNITPSGWGMKGEPDLITCINGRFVAFELKVGVNQMESDQLVKRDRIVKSGGSHFCPRSFWEFQKIVDEYDEMEGV